MGIFDRLHFNFQGDGILELSSNVKSFINTVPALLEPWQIKDISDNNVGGYFTNPVSVITQSLRNTCNNLTILISGSSANIDGNTVTTEIITGTSNLINTAFVYISANSANVGGTNGGEFIEHTNRISGVTPFGASPETGKDTALLPHYDTAMGTGQIIMYLTNQSDGIQNNAPIMGNFTSLLIDNDLVTLNTTISTYYETINTSLTITSTVDIDGNTNITRSSNLSYSVVGAMSNTILLIDTTLATRRVHDEQFYANSRDVADEYAQLKTFSHPGETANNLFQNYNGSTKLLTRINS